MIWLQIIRNKEEEIFSKSVTHMILQASPTMRRRFDPAFLDRSTAGFLLRHVLVRYRRIDSEREESIAGSHQQVLLAVHHISNERGGG
jgi:hypothetical protein